MIFLIIILTVSLIYTYYSYSCSKLLKNQNIPQERAVGIKDRIFEPDETVYITFDSKNTHKDNVKVLKILKKYAYPHINLNFKAIQGQKNDKSAAVIRFKLGEEKPSQQVSGKTTGIGSRQPEITLWKLNQGTVLHEFGHALGLYHEQSNPAPNNMIEWNVDNVLKKYKSMNWKEQDIYKQIINRNTDKNLIYTKWDPKSIMNYNITNPDLTVNNILIQRGNKYSKGDKAWFQQKYGTKNN